MDEVVSQSVARPGNVGRRRQRSESFTGPCVPTDLFFDTTGVSVWILPCVFHGDIDNVVYVVIVLFMQELQKQKKLELCCYL